MKMENKRISVILFTSMLIILASCKLPKINLSKTDLSLPSSYSNQNDTTNDGALSWRYFYHDTLLVKLINEALKNNQELKILQQEVIQSKNEINARRGSYLPFVSGEVQTAGNKLSRYTTEGVSEVNNPVIAGEKTQAITRNYYTGFTASWEIDIWNKLHQLKNASINQYLATQEGKNIATTFLVAEIARSYYELISLDQELIILQQNISIQKNALEIVKLEKTAAKVTELAVRKFEAEVLKNQSNLYLKQQEIVETENKINYLCGRFPQAIERNDKALQSILVDSIHVGIPSQLLKNRPDIRKAEKQILQANLSVKAARAQFLPSIFITSDLALNALKMPYLIKTPESMLVTLLGNLAGPIINRRAIDTEYKNYDSKQKQAVANYELTVLNSFKEVANLLSNHKNIYGSLSLKKEQVEALTQSIDISTGLFKSARADYMEVLLTQRDALESRIELIEIQKSYLINRVNLYQALGGGWK
jgi:NodT family efflux transporter outer membrane factor (OMF) lipoprotein